MSMKKTTEKQLMAFSHVSHRFTLVLAFLGSLLVCVVWFLFVLGLCFCVCFCFGWLPSISTGSIFCFALFVPDDACVGSVICVDGRFTDQQQSRLHDFSALDGLVLLSSR